jgi:hypothetical protein
MLNERLEDFDTVHCTASIALRPEPGVSITLAAREAVDLRKDFLGPWRDVLLCFNAMVMVVREASTVESICEDYSAQMERARKVAKQS